MEVDGPRMAQASELALLHAISEVVMPGFVDRAYDPPRLTVPDAGANADLQEVRREALRSFDMLVGATRVYKNTGVLRRGEGPGDTGIVRDRDGTQHVRVGTAIEITLFPGDVANFARSLRTALDLSTRLANALILFGRRDSSVAEWYAIFELAEAEFGDSGGIKGRLGISRKAQSAFSRAANNTLSLEGGRHAEPKADPGMSIDEQRQFTRSLLSKWVWNPPPTVTIYSA